MIITITCNTFEQLDSGQVTVSKPLDFALNFNNKVMSFYSLNSTLINNCESSQLWEIIEKGKNECHGTDTAMARTFTIISIFGRRFQSWDREEINFEILINHHEGLGRSKTLNTIAGIINSEFDTLHDCDKNFLKKLSGNHI